jgi:hypothetical protein
VDRRSLVRALAGVLLAACGERVVFDGRGFSRDPDPVSLAGRIVTTNNGDDTLSVLEPLTPSAPARVPVGANPLEIEGPRRLSVDPRGRFVYVNLEMPSDHGHAGPHHGHGARTPNRGLVVKLDAFSGRPQASVLVDSAPGASVLSADGRTLFVTHYDLPRWGAVPPGGDPRQGDSSLVVIDTERMTVNGRVAICPAANGVGLARDGRTLYATCGSDEIAVVDLAGPSLAVRRVPLGPPPPPIACEICPYALAVAPDDLVWVSNLGPSTGFTGRGSVMVFDPRLGEGGALDPGRTLSFRGSPMFPSFAPAADGYEVYLPEQSALESWIRVFTPGGRGQPGRERASIALAPTDCVRAHMLHVTTTLGGHLVCEGDNVAPGSFVWLDLARMTVLGARAIGVRPMGLAMVPDAPGSP